MRSLFRSAALHRSLALLVLRAGEDVPIEALAEFTGASRPSVLEAIKFLREDQLVLVRRVGRRHLYRANTDHPVYPAVAAIVGHSLETSPERPETLR